MNERQPQRWYLLYRSSLLRMTCTLRRHERRKDGRDGMAWRLVMTVPAVAWGLCHTFFAGRRSERAEHDLAIVAIIKNEAPYLAEWIECNRLMGVDAFYLYDNDSTDSTIEVLAPYVHAGMVVLRRMPGQARQLDAYNDALVRYGRECRYMAFIDADEFLFDEHEDMVGFLDAHVGRGVGGIALNWLVFGSSGQERQEEGLVIERFTKRGVPSFEHNRLVKTICRPECVLGVPNVHYCGYKWGYRAYDVSGSEVRGALTPPLASAPVPHINHYFTKSLDEYRRKRARGCADERPDRGMDDFYTHDRNEEDDRALAKLSGRVREALHKRLAG